MTYANVPEDYPGKIKRLEDVIALRTPDTVPIFMPSATWGYSYTKTKIAEVLHDKEKLTEGCIGYLKDIYSDVINAAVVGAPLQMYEAFDPPYPQHVITSDGYGLEHNQAAEKFGGMSVEEYPLLISDLENFMQDVIAPRKFPVLREPYPKNYEALKKGYNAVMEYISANVYGMRYSVEKYGTPCIATGMAMAPLDFLFDYLRTLPGIMSDIHRVPQQVIEACGAIAKFQIEVNLGNLKKGDRPMLPLHIPPYLRKSDFDKFYWPGFKKVVQHIIDKGATPILAFEGDWTAHLDHITEFPKGRIFGMTQGGNLKDFKKKYGGHFCICGGMPFEKVKYSAKQDCIDTAKRVLDELAPGGGFVFSLSMALISANDINTENYMAVVDTVRSCGKY